MGNGAEFSIHLYRYISIHFKYIQYSTRRLSLLRSAIRYKLSLRSSFPIEKTNSLLSAAKGYQANQEN